MIYRRLPCQSPRVNFEFTNDAELFNGEGNFLTKMESAPLCPPMELDLEHEYADRAYQLLVGLVTPRPIAFVTTISPDGKINAAPFSFFNVFGAEPPIVAFAPGDRDNGTPKDTALNIRATHEFVVNLVDEGIAEAMNKCAASLPYGENELTHACLTAVPSSLVKPPRIKEAPVSFECVEWGTLQIGENRMVVGVIKRLHLRDELFDAEKKRIHTERLKTIGRMAAPYWYCYTRERFEMVRPA
jgi:flavin reductase (DIM6/NTAB) family NADH-FMN oxidoreductase RutF